MTQTLPWSYYSDPEILVEERAQLFAGSWHYIGHSGDLPEPGSYLPTEVGGVPTVVTRDREGELHALVNVCRHRGTVVCREPGRGDSLTCPYHAWRYGLDGALRSAPRSAHEPHFQPDEHSLPRLPLEAWGPFLFIAPGDDVIPLAEVLGEIPAMVARTGIDVDDLEFHSRWEADLEANWKVVTENFLECYHCRVVHPEFSQAIDTSPEAYVLDAAPTYSTQYGPVREGWQGPYDPSGPIAQGQFHLIYPNTVVIIMPGQPNLSIGPIVPTGPTTTHRRLDYFFGPAVEEAWIKEMMAFDEQVGREDVALVEASQRGLSARPQERGTLFVGSEKLIKHFDEMILAAIGSTDSSQQGPAT